MKGVLKVMMLILGMACWKSHAQMGTATTVSWDVDVHFDVEADQDSVWTLLKDYTVVRKLSHGYVQRIMDKDRTLPISREVSLSNGQKREEILTQLDEQHKFLVYNMDKSSLPEGISTVQVAIFTSEQEGGKTSLNWKAIIQGKEEAKKQLLEQMKDEIEHYKTGWSEYLRKL